MCIIFVHHFMSKTEHNEKQKLVKKTLKKVGKEGKKSSVRKLTSGEVKKEASNVAQGMREDINYAKKKDATSLQLALYAVGFCVVSSTLMVERLIKEKKLSKKGQELWSQKMQPILNFADLIGLSSIWKKKDKEAGKGNAI